MNIEKTNFDSIEDIFANYKYVPRPRKPLNETQQAEKVEEEFDPKYEAKKLVAAWKRTEAEAEMIKQKATSKKEGQTQGKSLISKTKIDPKSLINKGLKTNQGLEKRGTENKIDPKGQNQKGPSVMASSLSKRPQTGSKPAIEKGATANFGGNILAEINANNGTKKGTSSKVGQDKSKVNSITENKKQVNTQKAGAHAQDLIEHSLDYSESLLSHDITQHSINRSSYNVRNENMKENEDYNVSYGSNVKSNIPKEEVPEWTRMPLTELDQDSELDLYGIDPADYMAAMEGYNKYKIEQEMKQRKKEFEKERLGYDDREEHEDVLVKMEKEHEEAKRQLYSFKITKLIDKIENVLQKAQYRDVKLAFAWLYGVLEGEKIKCLKAELVRQLRTKSLYFCLWIAFTRESKLEKEQRRAQAKQEREEAQMKKAGAFYDFILLRRYFEKGFVKYHQKLVQEKGVQKSQGRVKSAVDNFLNKLQAQAGSKQKFEQFDQQKMIAREDNKRKMDYEEPREQEKEKFPHNRGDKEYGSDIEEDIGSDGESDFRETGHFGNDTKEAWPAESLRNNYQGEVPDKQMGESISQSIAQTELSSRPGTSQRTHKQESKTLKQMTLNEKNLLFEEKARQRREAQDLIRKKHEDEKKKKEQEKREAELKEKEEIRKRKIEEKEAYERRRREEQEAQEAKRIAMEELSAKMAKAASFYDQQLLKRYGIRLVRKIQELKRANEDIADRFSGVRLMKLGFETWGQAIILKNINRQIKMAPKMEKADHKYEKGLKQKVLKSLQQAVLDSKVSDIQYDQYRKRVVQTCYFQEWCSRIPELRKEKLLYEEARNKIVEQFRYGRLSKIVFSTLKENAKTELKEKIKKEHKDVMWKKVSSWLNDYKAKKGNDDNEKYGEEF